MVHQLIDERAEYTTRRAGWSTVKGGKMEQSPDPAAAGYAHIPGGIITDPTLSPFASRIYDIVRLHDYGTGAGCFVSRQRMAQMGCMSERQVIYALAELRKRGYITTDVSTDGRSTSRHFVTDTGAPPAPPTSNNAPTGAYSAPGGAYSAPEGVQVVHPEVNELEVDEIIIIPREAQGHDEQAMALCTILDIPQDSRGTAVHAMCKIVADYAASAPRSLDDLALECAQWMDVHGVKKRTVARFRNWVKTATTGWAAKAGEHPSPRGAPPAPTAPTARPLSDEEKAFEVRRRAEAYLCMWPFELRQLAEDGRDEFGYRRGSEMSRFAHACPAGRDALAKRPAPDGLFS